MDRREKLEGFFQEAMERKGVLPILPHNKKTLRWLEKQGCVARYAEYHTRYYHPRERFENLDIRQWLRLHDAFRIWGDHDTGSRTLPSPLDWMNEGTMIEVFCRRGSRGPDRRRIVIWVPKDLADRILVLEAFP